MKFLLPVHNILRLVIVVLAIIVLVKSYRGWLRAKPWEDSDRDLSFFYTIALDIQFTIGLVLFFFLSPITKAAFSNFGAAMRDAVTRFFLIEHSFYMLLAVAFAHIANAAVKKDMETKEKFKRMSIFFSLSVLAIILGMPWSRPLLPQF